MRLIDADALKEKYFGKRGGLIHTADVDKAPTIAAFPVVRCKDCRYYYNTNPEQISTANIICCQMHEDDYCSYAERREVSE